MKLSLLDGLSIEEAEEAKIEFEKAFRFRKNLIRVLKDKQQTIIDSMCDDNNFQLDWPNLQLQKIAELKVLKKIINLLE